MKNKKQFAIDRWLVTPDRLNMLLISWGWGGIMAISKNRLYIDYFFCRRLFFSPFSFVLASASITHCNVEDRFKKKHTSYYCKDHNYIAPCILNTQYLRLLAEIISYIKYAVYKPFHFVPGSSGWTITFRSGSSVCAVVVKSWWLTAVGWSVVCRARDAVLRHRLLSAVGSLPIGHNRSAPVWTRYTISSCCSLLVCHPSMARLFMCPFHGALMLII